MRLGSRVRGGGVGPERQRLVTLHDRLAGEDRRLGPAVDEAADAGRAGRLERVARAIDVDPLEVLAGAPLLDMRRQVERGLAALGTPVMALDVAQVAPRGPALREPRRLRRSGPSARAP